VRARSCGHQRARPTQIVGPSCAAWSTPPNVFGPAESTSPRGCVHGGVATRGPGRRKLSDHKELRAARPRARADQPRSTSTRGCVHGGVALRGPGRRKLSDHHVLRGGPPRARPGQLRSTRTRGCVYGGVATRGPGRIKLLDLPALHGGPPRAFASQPRSTLCRWCVHGGVDTCGPDRCISGRGPRPNNLGNLAWSAAGVVRICISRRNRIWMHAHAVYLITDKSVN